MRSLQFTIILFCTECLHGQASGKYFDLKPSDLYASYINESDIANQDNLVLCAPDKGALPFVLDVQKALMRDDVPLLKMCKERRGEREVCANVADDSCIDLDAVAGKDVVVIDDMVRTGHTIVECCKQIKKANPHKVVFIVTHFYSSQECRMNLNDPAIDEIVTTSTIPQILNRDMQGRLRHKMVVLRIARWISDFLLKMLDPSSGGLQPPYYTEDMSSKNPRWKGKLGPLFSG
jgi:ribose-phosphate pyrophosphokinase